MARAQTDADLVESADTHYYDFWPGEWVEVVDGKPDASATKFTVRRSVNPAVFEERWEQSHDGVRHESTALRGWDQVNGRWMLAWVSDNALFQVWHGEKIGNHWYLMKEFEIGGEVVLSRQSWIPETETRVIRSLERSSDGGRTWATRYRSSFVRVSD